MREKGSHLGGAIHKQGRELFVNEGGSCSLLRAEAVLQERMPLSMREGGCCSLTRGGGSDATARLGWLVAWLRHLS